VQRTRRQGNKNNQESVEEEKENTRQKEVKYKYKLINNFIDKLIIIRSH
jgi:hypothetical protein